jgi:ABC-type transport system involved in cytochrome c biogenesis permease subunit
VTYKLLLKKRQGYSNYYELVLFLIGLVFIAIFSVGRSSVADSEMTRLVFSGSAVVMLGLGLLVYYKFVLDRDDLAFA